MEGIPGDPEPVLDDLAEQVHVADERGGELATTPEAYRERAGQIAEYGYSGTPGHTAAMMTAGSQPQAGASASEPEVAAAGSR